MTETYIIAEAGVNHNGSLEMAKELVDVAKHAGADAIKFQTFKAKNLVTKFAEQANYQVENLGEETSQYQMLKKLEFTFDQFTELKKYCDEVDIEFLSTPFDYESVDFLLDELHIKTVKIPSGEITNTPFLYYIASKRKPMIISTGMSTLDEIHEALSFIAYGLDGKREMSSTQIRNFYHTNEAKQLLSKYVTVLHCTTEYPAPFETINLKAMKQLREVFGVRIGLSDHSQGVAVATAAVALGAEVIEKHFTLDRTLEGPDHLASLEPSELATMIEQIRVVEQALGDGMKRPSQSEMNNRIAARKSLVAKQPIVKGESFTVENLTIKRPGNGLSPSLYWDFLGKAAKKSYNEDELINE